MLPSFLIALAGFATYLMVTLTLLRISSMSPAVLVCLSALALYPLTIAVALTFGMNLEFFSLSATYWFLCALFLLGFGAVYKSISLRILLDLLERPGRSEPYNDILARYILEDSFEKRLEVMRSSGFAVVRDGNLELTAKGRKLATRVWLLQKFFAIEKTG